MIQTDNLALLCLIVRKNRAAVADHFSRYRFDAERFREFAVRNNLSGYLYAALRDCHSLDLLPVNLIAHMCAAYTQQQRTNAKLIDQMERARALLAGSGIEVTFLKGPFFAIRYYDDVGQRAIADVDLLLRKERDIVHADQVLRSAGFERWSIPLFGRKLSTHFAHHFEYRKLSLKLDVHWSLQRHFSFRLNHNEIWNRTQTRQLDGTPYNVLCDEYELVFQILSVFMDTQLGTIRLKSFVDIYMVISIVNPWLDWEGFFAAREREGLLLIAINVMDLVLGVLDCRDEFGRLAEIVDRNHGLVKYTDMNRKLKLLDGSVFPLSNKMWAFKLYDAPLSKSFAWWLISLPVKLAVYRRNPFKPFVRSLK